MEHKQAKRLFLLKQMPQNAICAEIGVYKGNFSKIIFRTTQPKRLHLIDPWKYHPQKKYIKALFGGQAGGQEEMDKIYSSVRKRFSKLIEDKKVILHRKTSYEANKQFKNEYFDWIYIDGNHDYHYAKRDLETYFNKVKSGGFLTGDDYKKGTWFKKGVMKAVDEFVERNDVELVCIKNAQFIIKKK